MYWLRQTAADLKPGYSVISWNNWPLVLISVLTVEV